MAANNIPLKKREEYKKMSRIFLSGHNIYPGCKFNSLNFIVLVLTINCFFELHRIYK